MRVPWFIGPFLIASLCRNFVPGVATVAPVLSHLATIGLTVTLFLIAIGIVPCHNQERRLGERVRISAVGAGEHCFVASYTAGIKELELPSPSTDHCRKFPCIRLGAGRSAPSDSGAMSGDSRIGLCALGIGLEVLLRKKCFDYPELGRLMKPFGFT